VSVRLWGILCIWLSVPGLAFSQPAAVPENFRDLYSSLEQNVDAFGRTVSSQSAGQKSAVAWSAELLTANCNRGRALLAPGTHQLIRQELDSLQALGVKAVTICIGFPVLYQPFYAFNQDTEDYPRFLKFYGDLTAEIHGRGLKLIVESAILFLGSYSRESGFKLAEYYATLQPRQLMEGRAQNILAIAKEVRPDFLNLGSEPDTDAAISKQTAFKSPSGYAESVGYFVKQLRQAGVTSIPIGAGIGTWQPQGETYVRALLATGIDYLDLHVYAVNRTAYQDYLQNAITYADMAHAAGKQVAMSEAWLLKNRNSELGRLNTTNDPGTYARDRYSFWMPLDQKLLGALINYSNWKKLMYFSPFWTRYFWSYVDYDSSSDGLPAIQAMRQGARAAMQAMQQRKVTSTAEFYKNAIAGR
jgi:hypothetical protein